MSNSLTVVPLLAWFVLLSLAGCDDNTIITPFSERDAYFSLYGFISATDTQLVRVVPVRKRLQRNTEPGELRVTVTSTELKSGRIDMWLPVEVPIDNGSTGLQLSDSSFGHVYRAIFPPNSGEVYRLTVENFDGRASSATTTIPEVTQPELGEYFDVGGEVHQKVLWPGMMQQPFQVATWYFFGSTDLRPGEFAVPFYHNSFGEITPDGLTIDMNLNEDIRLLREHIVDNLPVYSNAPSVEDPETFHLILTDRRIRMFVGDSTWKFVSGVPDLARLSQPGSFSNVENGFGYFGGIGTSVAEAPITDPGIRRKMGLSS